jgi:RluA family pseudouridine synthase
MKTYLYSVESPDSGKRLDIYLLERIGEISRRKIRSIIDVGGVYVNKKRVRVASRAVTVGDSIRVEYNEVALKKVKAETFEFKDHDLLFSSYDTFAVNKPPGLPSQATKDQSIMHVVPLLEKYLKLRQIRYKQLILVHRLDKETSGLILVAEGSRQATWLSDQFRERKVKKTYFAVCHGIPSWTSMTERSALSEIDKKSGQVRAVRSGGRSALTRFRVAAVNEALKISLIECSPETGRSHQIRVHLEINGNPIVGDKRYGSQSQKSELPEHLLAMTGYHHFLHAAKLEFFPEAGVKSIQLNAAFPERMQFFINDAFPKFKVQY